MNTDYRIYPNIIGLRVTTYMEIYCRQKVWYKLWLRHTWNKALFCLSRFGSTLCFRPYISHTTGPNLNFEASKFFTIFMLWPQTGLVSLSTNFQIIKQIVVSKQRGLRIESLWHQSRTIRRNSKRRQLQMFHFAIKVHCTLKVHFALKVQCTTQ